MYKSIVFDLGGVMVDFAPRAYLVDRICNEEIEEQVYDLTFGSEEWKQLDAGLVSRFDGNQAMLRNAKAAGREFEVQGVLDDWLHILRPRRRMQELVRRLKNHGYSVYYLSNIPEDVLALLKEQGVRTAYGVVPMPNDASAALHRKLGFGLLGTYHNTGYKNGRWRDVVWFEKHIGSFDGVPEPIRPIGQLADREAVLRTI